MRKKGISLIVLIITIIVVIILAAVVILTLSKNNPIESAREARFKEDVRTFQDELAMYISKDYTNKAGQRDDKITATKYTEVGEQSSVYTYISSFSKKYEGKFIIKNDELRYLSNLNEKEKKWCKDLNISKNITEAEKAKEKPNEYYGKNINYTSSNNISDWKIFYSDGSNIYIITSDYVDLTKLPSKDSVKPENTNSSYPKAAPFDNIIPKYSGSSNITDEKMKAFNSDYFKEREKEDTGEKYVFSSKNNNMKAVAYMLDYSIWHDFVDPIVADYAIGGPSLEFLFNSYCEIYPEYKNKYVAKAKDIQGYQFSNDQGEHWYDDYGRMVKRDNRLYVLPSENGALGMWLSTPAYIRTDTMLCIYIMMEVYIVVPTHIIL